MILVAATLALLLPARPQGQVALGNAISYQGRLTDAGVPATGSYDLQFKLFDAATAGNAVGSTVTLSNVAVAAGVFTVSLDFGAGAFGGTARWLEVGVRPGGTSGAFTTLTPRQALLASPQALYASNANQLAGQSASFYTNLANQTGVLSVAQGGTGGAPLAGAPQSGSAIATLDSGGTLARYGSITIGADGLGLISYQDAATNDLKVAHCANVACSTVTLATLDSAGLKGRFTSITIGADGLGLISYNDDTNGDLKVAHCANVACSTATLATLDSPFTTGFRTSITIGADGLGLISYSSFSSVGLKVAHCANVACSTAALATLDSTADIQATSIAIGSDGLGLISYYGQVTGELRVAHCATVACDTATAATLGSSGGVAPFAAITIGADGLGLIIHRDATLGDLKIAHCGNASCSPFVVRHR